jgi:hypothetical protein
MRLRSLLGVAVAAVALVTGGCAVTQPADAATPTVAPYGGCGEVLQDFPAYLHTQGADWCRAHGWTIRRHFVLNPRNQVRWIDLPPCGVKDTGCFVARDNWRGVGFIVTPRERIFWAHF